MLSVTGACDCQPTSPKLAGPRKVVGNVYYQCRKFFSSFRDMFGQVKCGPNSDQLITLAGLLHEPGPIKDRNLTLSRCN